MKINDLFLKDIHRNIEGVITASKASDEMVYQELDEYVVTKELQGHFKSFFDAYKKGILGDTSKMGVWIQGFFGSGKSHFLKILSYILENKEINGKTALDFFTDGDESTRKIKDAMTLADMKLAADTPTNVILFNVESKHQTGIEEKNSLVNVFLKVFNDSLGYSTIPQLADLERNLDKQGKYAEFKQTFEKVYGKSWEESRHEIDFLEDEIVETLVKVNYFSETAARNWFTKFETDYKISIEEFANLVEEYLAEQGNNQHIVFLVDEVGQYIGGNRSLTLQLQTIVEELGNKSHGKAWVIVTSQEKIDSVTDISGSAATDFSKIKGRFETTLSLSSANADEVIQKRILKKNGNGQEYLEADYPNHEHDLKLKLQFEDSPELKLYSNAENYADVYPFIPYQFNLLANILTQISQHSIQGTNLSRGERSLLAFFKETAERNADNDTDVLVSLDQFYPSLEKWLNETKNDSVIKRAYENTFILPNQDDTFNIDVLKVLFMIKYVDQNIKPTINNITNLMIRRLNEDKMELRKKVENALQILISQNMVRKNLQSYIFQTDEEQEVTNLINNIEVNPSDIENKLAVDIFDEKIGKNSFSYINRNLIGKSAERRYNFSFNRYIDDFMYGKSVNPQMEVKIITPLDEDLWGYETQLTLTSTKNILLVNVPLDDEYMNDIRTYLKVEKYVTTTFGNNTLRNFQAVKSEKNTENQELKEALTNQLTDFLKESTFYFNNNQLEVKGSDFRACINDALQQMAKLIYHKNVLVNAAVSEQDINKYLNSRVDTNTLPVTENQNVMEEVYRYIDFQSKHITVTMKTLRDHFVGKEPYGFVNEDLEWAVARLVKEGRISLYKNGVSLYLTDNVKEVASAIFERRSPEKIRIEIREIWKSSQKNLVKDIGEELFGSRNIVDDNNDDITKENFIKRTDRMIAEFESYYDYGIYHYPESAVIEKNIKILHQLKETTDTSSFYKVLSDNEDALLDWAEAKIDIETFHKGVQKTIWKQATEYVYRVEHSTLKQSTPEIEEVIASMKAIMRQVRPYNDIQTLKELNMNFQSAYLSFLEGKAVVAGEKVNNIKNEILDVLATYSFVDKYKNQVIQAFNQLIDELQTYETLDKIELAPIQAQNLQDEFYRKFKNEPNPNPKPVIEPDPKPLIDDETPTYTVDVSLYSVSSSNKIIENKEDIDHFLSDFKKVLIKEIDRGHYIRLKR